MWREMNQHSVYSRIGCGEIIPDGTPWTAIGGWLSRIRVPSSIRLECKELSAALSWTVDSTLRGGVRCLRGCRLDSAVCRVDRFAN